MMHRIGSFLEDPRMKLLRRWTLYGVLIGIVSGIGAVIFYGLLSLVAHYTLGGIAGYYPVPPAGEAPLFAEESGGSLNRLFLLVIPAFGGLISGVIVYTFAPETEGDGTDAMIEAYNHKRGIIRRRVPIVKSIASAITIGTGGNAGREGPITQIGAGFGSALADRLSLSDRDRRMMVLCGSGAGLASIFRAPFGGVLFALEILYQRDIEMEAIIPAFVSSAVGYSVFTYVFGWGSLFRTPDFVFSHPSELLFHGALGLICAGVGILYVKTFHGMRKRVFKPLRIKNHYKPAIGGLAIGVMAYFYPDILGTGYGLIQGAIDGELVLSTLLLLLMLKILAISFTVGSGGSGGLFAPTLVVGAMLGGAFGTVAYELFPGIIPQPASFVLVGMAAMLAGVAKIPITAIVIVSELTGSYHLLAPLMLASTAAYALTGSVSLYEKQVPTRADSPAHRKELTVNILETITVGRAMDTNIITVSPEKPVRMILDLVYTYGHRGYPVVKDQKLIGIITVEDVGKVPAEERNTRTIGEIMTRNVITATPDETLEVAHKRLIKHDIGRLPVVLKDDPERMVGMLTRSDIIRMHAKISSQIAR